MTNNRKKWLIRISEKREKIARKEIYFIASFLMSLFAICILFIIEDAIKLHTNLPKIFIIIDIFVLSIMTISILMIIIWNFIKIFLMLIHENKEILLSNHLVFVLLSEEVLVKYLFNYIIACPLLVLAMIIILMLRLNFIVMSILTIISLILLAVLATIFPKKISTYFKKKLS